MLYLHHGLGKAFTSYEDYFGDEVDEDALVYLALANRLVHAIRPDAVTIAEDVSGMPGLAVASEKGGTGFDYRFAMGVPDFWIRLTKDVPDEKWPTGRLWYELTNRRKDEKTISYAESHDQAIVGDQTLIFRLIGSRIYDHMRAADTDLVVDRGVALHKLIRLITLSTAGAGYLNFMGNEFGHPEWIDFPREGNRWSYHYARRQWHLADDPALKYRYLGRFDRAMIALARRSGLLEDPCPVLLHEHSADKVIAFKRAKQLFVFSFNPHQSLLDYPIAAPAGEYRIVLDSDAQAYGGHGRVDPLQHYFTLPQETVGASSEQILFYLPTRTALVLEQVG
jgi:1,4-alpha-glucan branching enzyme